MEQAAATRSTSSLSAWRWPEVEAGRTRTLLVPVGSCEQHGPHLPFDTDTRIAVELARRAAAAAGDVAVAPPVAYGSSGEHQDFSGTLSIGTVALRDLLVELGRSAFAAPAAWVGAVVFVNGHGGNRDALDAAVTVLAGEARPVSAWWPTVPGGDAHAGRTETSLLLAIDPDAVGRERPRGATAPVGDLLPQLRRDGVRPVSPNGVLGDAAGSSAAEGRTLLAALVADLGRHLAGIAPG